jgi:DNA-binding transcriptional MerR regulator
MSTLLTIGEFSRLTHVSVKALRHYHDMGLLAPTQIDRSSGYRFYAAAQAPTAQLIRRFREMDMPLDQIRAVLEAPDPAARDAVIVAHLKSMERQLGQTQTTVASLRALLEGGAPGADVELRTLRPSAALTMSEPVAWDDTEDWLRDAFSRLRRQVSEFGASRSGPDGALYSEEFFEAHLGEVTAFIPIQGASPGSVPMVGSRVAVATHRGSFAELDQVYAALGTFVAERAIGVGGAIRENYLVGFLDTSNDESLVTEVCWPILPAPQ